MTKHAKTQAKRPGFVELFPRILRESIVLFLISVGAVSVIFDLLGIEIDPVSYNLIPVMIVVVTASVRKRLERESEDHLLSWLVLRPATKQAEKTR